MGKGEAEEWLENSTQERERQKALCRSVSVRLGKGYPNLLLPEPDQPHHRNHEVDIDYIEEILVPYLTARNKKLTLLRFHDALQS